MNNNTIFYKAFERSLNFECPKIKFFCVCVFGLFYCFTVVNFKKKSFLERRQTMLFSATQTRKTEDLARISLKKEPIYVGVHDTREIATVEGLEQVLWEKKQKQKLRRYSKLLNYCIL